MWNESYRLGVDLIDQQHIELFEMTTNLLKKIENANTSEQKKECESAIIFLKEYSIKHFVDEEEYQKSIRYVGFTEHRKMHQEFTASVLEHEKKMALSDFDIRYIKEFIGMLVAWLVYHVADADQKIIITERPQMFVIDSLFTASCYVLKKMAHLRTSDIKRIDDNSYDFKDDITVSVDLTGDVPGVIKYVYTEEFIFNFVASFLFTQPKSIDSLVCATLLEVSNIISKNVVIELVNKGIHCAINTPILRFEPSVFLEKDFFILETRIGKIKMGILA